MRLDWRKPAGFAALLMLTVVVPQAGAMGKQVPAMKTGILLRSESLPEANPEYKKILKVLPNPALREKAKILYLISRIKHSSYRFERNGVVFDSRRAAMHLMMKYRAVKDQVETAEEFVFSIGSGSHKTGKPYFILTGDGARYPSRDVLMNELAVLEESLAEYSTPRGSETFKGDAGL